MRTVVLLVLIVTSVAWVSYGSESARGTAPAAPAADFWSHWGDGKAELSGYELVYPRYGRGRAGTAVTIFVTEEFADSVRVKNEDSERDRGEVYPVMKLNWIQDFPTGLYDYSLMTSAFSALAPVSGRPAKSLAKVSFSSQEWCGHVYAQLLFDAERVRLTSHSYFDGEADQERAIDAPRGGLSEDALLLWARGFAGPELSPGESKTIPLLRSLEHSRLRHFEIEWQDVTIARGNSSKEITVPAGTFAVDTYTVEVPELPVAKTYPAGHEATLSDYTWTIEVESAEPHRVIRWARSDGLEARLVGSDRMPYWTMNGPGFEDQLERIGLKKRPPRTP